MENDVYRATFHFENPSGKSSFGLYFREDAANATQMDICKDIAESLHTRYQAVIRACMTVEWWFTAIRVRKVHPTEATTVMNPGPNTAGPFNRSSEAQYTRTVDGQSGTYNGGANEPALPANNCMQIDLEQSTFGLRSNGRINIPGIPEAEQSGPNLTPAHVATVNAVAALMDLPLTSAGDSGVWDPVIVSAKVRDAAGPGNPKDWINSIALVDNARCNPIISIQRRRTTRVVGAAA